MYMLTNYGRRLVSAGQPDVSMDEGFGRRRLICGYTFFDAANEADADTVFRYLKAAGYQNQLVASAIPIEVSDAADRIASRADLKGHHDAVHDGPNLYEQRVHTSLTVHLD